MSSAAGRNRSLNARTHTKKRSCCPADVFHRRLLCEPLEDRRLLGASPVSASLEQTYGQIPMSFEVNQGQTAASVQYLAAGSGYALFLTRDGAVLSLEQPSAKAADAASSPANPSSSPTDPSSSPADLTGVALDMQLVGGNPQAAVAGEDLLPGTSSYFIGNDPSQWRTGVANYGRVAYQNVYPGVNLVYYGNQQQLEYDFTVAPGATRAASGSLSRGRRA